jgi:KUP system potassium uptake protein
MVTWFLVLGIFGSIHIFDHIEIIRAFNPMYAYNLITHSSSAIVIMGAVFLCTTGAEALYSDLGHCGAKNIRVSWIFVKVMLILNYLGQGAWLLDNYHQVFNGVNPFFGIMPQWAVLPGVILATAAAIIASQAVITGSFTMFSEAMSISFWPNQHIEYPSGIKGLGTDGFLFCSRDLLPEIRTYGSRVWSYDYHYYADDNHLVDILAEPYKSQ